MEKYREVMEKYSSLTQDKRMKLQYRFGNDNVANRETKFYDWLLTKCKICGNYPMDKKENSNHCLYCGF